MNRNKNSVIAVNSDDEDEAVDDSRNERSTNESKNRSDVVIESTDDESEFSSNYIDKSKISSFNESINGLERSKNATIDDSGRSHLSNPTDLSAQDIDHTYDSELEESFNQKQTGNYSNFGDDQEINDVKQKSLSPQSYTATRRKIIMTDDSEDDDEIEESFNHKQAGDYSNFGDDQEINDVKQKSLSPQSYTATRRKIIMTDDSEDDDELEESVIGVRKKNGKKTNQILSDSEDDGIVDNQDIVTDRLSPMIRHSIRRSILNITRPYTSEPEDNSEEDPDEDDERGSNMSHSEEVVELISDGEDKDDKHDNKKKKKGFIVSDCDEDESDDQGNQSVEQHSNDASEISYENKNQEKSFTVSGYIEDESDDQGNKSVKEESNDVSKISYESSSSNADEKPPVDLKQSRKSRLSNVDNFKERKSIKPEHNQSAVVLSDGGDDENYSIHEEESVHQENASNDVFVIDSATSTEDEREIQSKISLSKMSPSELEKKTQELIAENKRIQAFLRSKTMELIPDKGEKMKNHINKNIEEIKMYQKRLHEIQPPEKSDSSVISLDESHDASYSNKATTDDSVYEPDESYEEPKKSTESFNRTQMMKPTADTDIKGLGKKALETYQNEQALTVERLEHFHGSLLSRPTEDTQADDPRGLVVNLMPHQKHALAWLMWREQQKPRGGVLADDMGLGKTLTMISLVIKTLAENSSDDEDSDSGWMGKSRQNELKGGTLVVCPASLINQWKTEVERRCKRGVLAVEVYHGTNREKVGRRLARNDMVITTYSLLTREAKKNGQIYQIRWKRVILDEAHCIRNYKSQSCEAVCQLKAVKRWALTGTPIHNKEIDIYAILKFLQCSPFDDLRVWKRWVDNKSTNGIQRLATVMKTLMLRRTKTELISKGEVESLPEKLIDVIKVKLDEPERLVYDKVMLHSKELFAQFLHQRAQKEALQQFGAASVLPLNHNNQKFNKAQQKLLAHHAGEVKSHEILRLLLRLRQVCCQPALIHAMLDKEDMETDSLEGDDPLAEKMMDLNLSVSTSEHGDDDDEDIGVDKRITENLLTSDNPVFETTRKSSKLRVVLDIVKDVMKKNEKMIIVSQWTAYLDIIGDCLRSIPGASFDMFTGKVAVKNRQAIVDAFNLKKRPQILLLSLTAGGVGLNLVGANHLILADIHWNPQLESQAQDRIYRFGQKKNVFIYKILCSDTIEERIQALQESKIETAASVLDGSRKVSSKLTLQDMKSLFDM